jgi:hypothetical protein
VGELEHDSLVNRIETHSSNLREFSTLNQPLGAAELVIVIDDRAVNRIFLLVSVR